MPKTLDDMTFGAATYAVVTGTVAFATQRCRLYGWNLSNSASPGTLTIYDATSTGGAASFTIKSAASDSTSRWFGPQGIRMSNGVHAAATGDATIFFSLEN